MVYYNCTSLVTLAGHRSQQGKKGTKEQKRVYCACLLHHLHNEEFFSSQVLQMIIEFKKSCLLP